MVQSTRGTRGGHDAAEEEANRLASRITDDTEPELEDLFDRANQRLEEIFGYALAQNVPEELRLKQSDDRIG
jgi:hypothetical protein